MKTDLGGIESSLVTAVAKMHFAGSIRVKACLIMKRTEITEQASNVYRIISIEKKEFSINK